MNSDSLLHVISEHLCVVPQGRTVDLPEHYYLLSVASIKSQNAFLFKDDGLENRRILVGYKIFICLFDEAFKYSYEGRAIWCYLE